MLVTVGSAEHPMLPEHYIEWVLQTKQVNQHMKEGRLL
ncbi:desulfoferrodoxin family protein [Enterocloster clostridioformis]